MAKEINVKPVLFNERETSKYLSLSLSWLRQSRMLENGTGTDATTRTRGPRFIRIGARAVRYRITDLDAWIAEQAGDLV